MPPVGIVVACLAGCHRDFPGPPHATERFRGGESGDAVSGCVMEASIRLLRRMTFFIHQIHDRCVNNPSPANNRVELTLLVLPCSI